MPPDLARNEDRTDVIAVDPYRDATGRDPRTGYEVMLRAIEIRHHQHATLRHEAPATAMDGEPTIDVGREAALGALAESLDQLLDNVKNRRALAGDARTKPAVL